MLAVLVGYVAILVAVSVYSATHVKAFDDFATAGRQQTFPLVFLSLMATMLGASTTLGIADRVPTVGFAAFWWLGVGSVGLLLQACLLSKKVRALDACTLPDAARITVGPFAKTLIGLLISMSWIGVVAAQLVCLAQIVGMLAPAVNHQAVVAVVSLFVILHAMFGGQLSIMKTDALQACVIFAGLLATFAWLFLQDPAASSLVLSNAQLFNSAFDMPDLAYLLLIAGGAFFLGPDIISRNLASKDGRTAQRAALAAAIALTVCGIVIALIALWCVTNIPTSMRGDTNPLLYVMTSCLPYPITLLLGLGLIAALMSSTDTCLVNAASIFEHDVLNRRNVRETRAIVCVVGLAALGIALFRTDIIGLLLDAYSIYTPGIVCPLALALWFHGTRSPNRPLWCAAVIIGSSLGLLHTAFGIGPEWMPLAGMTASFVLGRASFFVSQQPVLAAER